VGSWAYNNNLVQINQRWAALRALWAVGGGAGGAGQRALPRPAPPADKRRQPHRAGPDPRLLPGRCVDLRAGRRGQLAEIVPFPRLAYGYFLIKAHMLLL